ncbi:MAG: nicotinate (nicotinamide) nucleotide adenylyltransferase [Epsilonproteobacteria bacterium]|nr:nicotinate (nicotinamide) nucleotide adenylyltransferase [Campylobacterota bacterium]
MFKDKQETIALFGGSFDPPHIGHFTVVNGAIKMLNVDKVIIVPAFLNPFKTSSLATPEKRLNWTKEIFKNLPKVKVDDYEIKQGKATPTAKTVEHFQKEYHVKYLIIGADNLASLNKWYNFEWLNRQITWVIATRAGHEYDTSILRSFEFLDIEVDISSTQIRQEQSLEEIENHIKILSNKKGQTT